MAHADAAPMTFADTVWPARGVQRVLRSVSLILLGSLLLTVSAKIQVPFYPVPMTLQTLVVLLLGFAYGARLGVASVLLYLAEGALGLPVFAGTPERGVGLAYMLGPTGGYLIGFVLAAGIMGWVAERRRDAPALVGAVLAGTLLIYVPGVLWLAQFTGLEDALAFGVLPFLPGDLVKAGLVMALACGGAAVMRRRLGG